jgi:hypothetical protein
MYNVIILLGYIPVSSELSYCHYSYERDVSTGALN